MKIVFCGEVFANGPAVLRKLLPAYEIVTCPQ